jgi:hypothetical protein
MDRDMQALSDLLVGIAVRHLREARKMHSITAIPKPEPEFEKIRQSNDIHVAQHPAESGVEKT